MRPYRPSNGSEGEWFTDKFCDQCLKDKEWREKEKNPCDILGRSMAFNTREEQYPKEWIYGENGSPTCTAFVLDTPENVEKEEWKKRRDPKTIDMFEQQ